MQHTPSGRQQKAWARAHAIMQDAHTRGVKALPSVLVQTSALVNQHHLGLL